MPSSDSDATRMGARAPHALRGRIHLAQLDSVQRLLFASSPRDPRLRSSEKVRTLDLTHDARYENHGVTRERRRVRRERERLPGMRGAFLSHSTRRRTAHVRRHGGYGHGHGHAMDGRRAELGESKRVPKRQVLEQSYLTRNSWSHMYYQAPCVHSLSQHSTDKERTTPCRADSRPTPPHTPR